MRQLLVPFALLALLLGACEPEPGDGTPAPVEEPDPGTPLDDDDDRGEPFNDHEADDCNVLIRVARDAALPPLDELMKISILVVDRDDVDDRGRVRGEPINSRTVYTPGALVEPEDRYLLRICAPPGDVAVVLHLDANWDDDACTEGDYHGWTLATVEENGDTEIDLLVNRVQGESDCGH